MKKLRNLLEILGFFVAPAVGGYYLGREIGRGIYNIILYSTTELYRNITSMYNITPRTDILVEKINQTGLDYILMQSFGIAFGGLFLSLSTYLYIKYKIK